MTNPSHPDEVAAKIKKQYPQYQPKIGIVLGSGLGGFVENLEDRVVIPYGELSGFPKSSVHGHAGQLVLGRIAGKDIVCLQGRAHHYEGIQHEAMKMYVRTLKRLGCEYFIATNAAGSLNPEANPGELMLITDHINFQPFNPLVGPNDDDFGPRFLPVDSLYNLSIREQLLATAAKIKIHLHQGVYIAVLGPNYETAAEIKAFRILGADVVGMSTVPEVLIAHHCGMKVAVISTITNFATGLTKVSHDHLEVVKIAQQGGERLNQLLCEWIKS